jgi:putative DNA primase/helicase
MIENIYAFAETIRAAGLNPPEHIEPGRFHRFPGIGKRNGNTAGWCKLFDDGMGGSFGDYSNGLSESWQAEHEQPFTEAERVAFRRQVAESRKQAEAQRLAEQEQAATQARQRWETARPADPCHLYLVKKQIRARGARQEGDMLLIPLRDESGHVWALQTISPDGGKLFSPAGCRTKGLYFSIGQPAPGGPVCIVEGFATGAAIHEGTGWPVACAMTAGNLEAVARIIKGKLPGHQIVICADDDSKPDTEKNPGIEAATKAALAVDGLLAVPNMGKKADFWDVWSEHGADAVRAAIDAAQPVKDQHGGQDEAYASNQETETLAPVDPVATIKQLAGLSAVEYELKRKAAAEALGIRASALDSAVKEVKKGKDENDLPFDEPDPWPVPVDPDQLLTDIASAIQRFIVCSKEVAHAVALWAAMSWFMAVVQVAPLAVITAPEKRCGKSQLLFLLGRLSARSITASSISPAALYRAIDAWSPTLLIDEADAFMKDNEELRGIINSGHTRDSAYVIRTVGDTFTPTKFNTWGAKAIAGIGKLADTLMDRAVILELRRKLPHESVDRLRYAEPDLFHNLRSKLARFAEDYSEQVRQARPPLPAILNDRAQDNWEPLLAIAMAAGGHWLEIGTAAALKLSGTESAAQTIGTELLADIQEILEAKGTDRISTADLIKALCEDDEKVWSTHNRGNPIKPRQLANKLKGYGISSNTIRIGITTPKGFMRDQFSEAFSRYLSPPPLPSATPPHPLTNGHLPVADARQRCGNVADSNSDNLLFNRNCCGVADRDYLTDDGKVEVEI